MSTFDIVIRAPGLSEATGGADQLENKLGGAEAAAAKTSAALTGVGTAAVAAGAAVASVGAVGSTSMDKAREAAAGAAGALGGIQEATVSAIQAYEQFKARFKPAEAYGDSKTMIAERARAFAAAAAAEEEANARSAAAQVQEQAAVQAAVDAERQAKAAATAAYEANAAAAEEASRRVIAAQVAQITSLEEYNRASAQAKSAYLAAAVPAGASPSETLDAKTSAYDSLVAEHEALEALRAPMREYNAALDALDGLYKRNKISVAEYESEVAKVIADAGTMQGPVQQAGDALKREEAAYKAIRGAMIEYNAQLDATDRLLQKGSITAVEHANEVERLAKKYGTMQGPVQQVSKGGGGEQTAATGGISDSLLGGVNAAAQHLGPVGDILSGIITKGTVAAGAVVGLSIAVIRLGDSYITLANRVEQFTAINSTVNDTLAQQLELSKQLHTSMTASVAITDAVHDSTLQMNLSQQEQLELTRSIGSAVAATGGGADRAAHLVQSLALSFQEGMVSGTELQASLRAFPEVGNALARSLGVSTREMVMMAKTGRLSSADLVGAFNAIGPAMEEKVKGKAETTGQAWEHMTDSLSLSVGQFMTSTGASKAIGTALEGVAKAVDLIVGAVDIATQPVRDFISALSPVVDVFKATIKGAYELGYGIGELLEKMDPEASLAHEIVKRQTEIAQAYLNRLEVLKRLDAAETKNADTARTASAARGLGINIGPFDEATANRMAEVRFTLEQSGIKVGDSFGGATSKAQQFNNELDKMVSNRAAQKVAEDVKRIYDAMQGVNDLMDSQFKKWHDLGDKINTARGAIERWKAVTPDGVEKSQEQRQLQRDVRDMQIEQEDSKYGKFTVSTRQRKEQTADEIRDIGRAEHEGTLSSEEFRLKYRELATTLNDGRLPSVIAYWERFRLPIQYLRQDFSGLDATLRSGIITLDQYRAVAKELGDNIAPGLGAALDSLSRNPETGRQFDEAPGKKQMRLQAAGHQAQLAQDSRQDAIGDPVIESVREYEQRLIDVRGAVERYGLSAAAATVLERQARDSFDATAEALTKITPRVERYDEALAKLQVRRDAGILAPEQYQAGVAQLDRSAKIAESAQEPFLAYQRALADIQGAVREFGLSQDQARVMTRSATNAYLEQARTLNGTRQVLESILGPEKAYHETIDNLGTALTRGDITTQQYARAVDQARLSFLQASQAGRTFMGGLEAGFLRAKMDAESFGATVAGTVLSDVDKLNDAIVSAANNGKVSWSAMIESMIEDLEKLILKQIEVGAMTALIGAFSGGGAIPGVNAPITMPSQVGSAGPANLGASAFTPPPVPAAYTFPATPAAATATPAAAAPSFKIVNVIDPSTVHAAMDTPTGQQIIVNSIRANQPSIRPTSPRRG